MRRTPDDTLPSFRTLIRPISPVARVCVPPQSSVEKSPILIDAHLVAIFFAEQRHGLVFVDRDIDRHVFNDFDLLVAQHFLVDHVFDVLQLFVRDRGEVREVKAQMVGRHQRSCLLHMLAQHFAQPGLQQDASPCDCAWWPANVGIDDSVNFLSHTRGCPTLPRSLRRVGISMT